MSQGYHFTVALPTNLRGRYSKLLKKSGCGLKVVRSGLLTKLAKKAGVAGFATGVAFVPEAADGPALARGGSGCSSEARGLVSALYLPLPVSPSPCHVGALEGPGEGSGGGLEAAAAGPAAGPAVGLPTVWAPRDADAEEVLRYLVAQTAAAAAAGWRAFRAVAVVPAEGQGGSAAPAWLASHLSGETGWHQPSARLSFCCIPLPL